MCNHYLLSLSLVGVGSPCFHLGNEIILIKISVRFGFCFASWRPNNLALILWTPPTFAAIFKDHSPCSLGVPHVPDIFRWIRTFRALPGPYAIILKSTRLIPHHVPNGSNSPTVFGEIEPSDRLFGVCPTPNLSRSRVFIVNKPWLRDVSLNLLIAKTNYINLKGIIKTLSTQTID